MSDPQPGAVPKRPTPWSVLIAAAAVFAVCAWLWNELRKDAAEMEAEREAAAARASASGRPKILGLDVIPQEAPATAEPSASAAPAVGAVPSASPSASASAARPAGASTVAPATPPR